jgi:uncharacterized protein YcfL
MRSKLLRLSLLIPLILTGCNAKEEEEEVDYDSMVMNEEIPEWTSAPEQDGKLIAGDLYPAPQEIMTQEAPDSPSPLDVSTIR